MSAFGPTPPLPLCADVLYVWPLGEGVGLDDAAHVLHVSERVLHLLDGDERQLGGRWGAIQ